MLTVFLKVCVAEGTSALERATELASHASLFSDNEDLDEVPTSSLKQVLPYPLPLSLS